MNFHTEYIPSSKLLTLSPEKPTLLIGSCFSQNMTAKMREHGWEASNIAGTLYNPLSIALVIDILLDLNNGIDRFIDSLSIYNGVWNSSLFDSSFSSLNCDDSIAHFRNSQILFNDFLSRGQQLILTFGTSICYFDIESKQAVGNCHKKPSNSFFKRRLTVEEIASIWEKSIKKLKDKFPYLKIIFTVSPVRHLKDGFVGNALSKSVLLLAVEEICNNNNTIYFPAFEILNDDLRDYRFYANDLVHPSDSAIQYIWEKFIESFLSPQGIKFIEEESKKIKARNHRPHPGALGNPLS
ncbi:MAG: GSCFA domain-containing protein [Muribaculaceae bacterium]|nr:GSCFA domain-containing protein [Muribaculaceae bacterium]